MSSQKHREIMNRLDKCYKEVLQSSAKGIRAVEIAEKLGIHRTMVHRHLNSLELMGKVESQKGIWRAKTGEQTIKPLEKEIVIELPLPKDQWQRVTLLEALSKDWEESGLSESGNIYKISLEKLKETRTIRIKGKNVDDVDLEKLGNLIQQANKKASKVNLKGLLKSLRRPHTDAKTTNKHAESSSA